MFRRRLLLWPIVLGTLVALGAAAFFINRRMRAERAQESDAVQREKLARAGVIKLSPASAQAMGLAVDAATSAEWAEERIVYGRVVPNPKATIEVRSPYGGTVRLGAEHSWPTPGEHVKARQPLGWIEVRVSPQERLDLQTKLSDARFKQQGAETIYAIQQERVARFEKSPSTLARNDLDQALVQRADAWTQLGSARATAELYQHAVDRLNCPETGPWSQLVTAPFDGEVVELTAQPGMNVEAGAVLLRITDPSAVLVRLDLPPEVLSRGRAKKRVDVSLAGSAPPGMQGPNNRNEPAAAVTTVAAELVGPAPVADAASQLLGFWYRLDPSSPATENLALVWRPGMFVTAALPTGAKQEVVSVADGALLYHQGRALVYVKIDANRYERREVRVLGRAPGKRWALAEGVKPGELVVSVRAQALLSEEFRGDVDND
jgi:biotin carboxyl carrier protein